MKKNETKKMMVSGGIGWLGVNICEHFLKNGYEVIAADQAEIGKGYFQTNHQELLKYDSFHYLPKNLFSLSINDLKGVDILINCATIMHPSRTNKIYEVNERAPLYLARLAEKCNVSTFIQISSCSVVGHIEEGAIINEETPYTPKTHYAKAKMLAEKGLIDAFSNKSNLKVIILRPGIFYHGHPSENIVTYIQKIKQGMGFTFGKEGFYRSYISVADLLNAVHHSIDNGKHLQPYYIVNDEPAKTLTLQNWICKSLNVKVRSIRLPLLMSRIFEWSALLMGMVGVHQKYFTILGEFGRNQYYSNSLAKEQLNWNPESNTLDGFKEMIQSLNEQKLL